ncbi:MAG: hypothetical protein K940chlam1_00687 [Candidatus Anoxychlamydiales bacterium]|nr:hypothetical protein [Candidatus Anoxychlamydiales bacterium]NGX36331.1 hypothetical protein [Candidatus Anoxychlamydiales bacterium]
MQIIQKDRQGKPASETAIDNHKIKIFDGNTSLDEVIFGGRVLNLVNDIAREVATSHSEIKCNTVAVDSLRYFAPIKRGDILICKVQVNNVWIEDNILEVGSTVIAEDFRSLEQKKILSAYFIFKTIDDIEIPEVIPYSLDEKQRYLDAEKRKNIREKKSVS